MQVHGLKMGEFLPSIRVMVSGTPMGPDVYLMLQSIGASETASRITSGLEMLG
jgi:glutamyl/glutaminyl-tRNA synthetase